MNIIDYGWNEQFQNAFDEIGNETLIPARIIADYGQSIKVVSDEGEFLVEKHVKESRVFGVGDFICLSYDDLSKRYFIEELLPRKTKFSRAASGAQVKEQIVAANIDIVFVIQSLNRDFNVRRLERYLISAWESGAEPVVVLTKSDLCEDADEMMAEVYSVAVGVNTHAVSAITGEGIEEVKSYFCKGKTIALLGSSGVGKSTLVNTLAGKEVLKTQEVLRDDDRGRHTTTHRQLVLLPDGGVVMDTPGMRTLGLWEADTGLDNLFSDIEELASECRFSDCRHISEPGCAVKQALDSGTLDEDRWKSYKKLLKELAYTQRKNNENARRELREIGRQFGKKVRNNRKIIW